MKVIGLAGYARSGKDTAGRILASHGFVPIAYADALRDFLYAQNAIVGIQYKDSIRVQDVIDSYGWDDYKNTGYAEEMRRLIQRTGTEAGRGVIGNRVWINAILARMDKDKNYVVTDVRFDNEAKAISDGVYVISKPGVMPPNDHASEKLISPELVHGWIVNDGTLQDLEAKLLHMLY